MKTLTFNDLVNLKADEWNTRVAEEYGVPVEELKDILLLKGIKSLDSRLQTTITKYEIEELANNQIEADYKNVKELKKGNLSIVYEPTIIDKFRVHITDTTDIVDSIALTGKIIIGADFSKSNLSDSYFCGCTFYECNLENVNFGNSVIVSSDFIACKMNKIDFNGSTISRTHIYEADLTESVFDYVALTDSMIVNSIINKLSNIQSRILFTGFNDCIIEYSNWKDSDIIQCSFTNSSLQFSNFKRAVMVDSIIIRSNLKGCELNSLSVTCITLSNCKYDDKYEHLFNMDKSLYSPSVFEWEPSCDDGDDEIEDIGE